MKISLKNLQSLYLAHQNLLSFELSGRFGYMAAINLQVLEPAWEEYVKRRQILEMSYAHKEDGQIMRDLTGGIIFDDEEKYQSELDKLQRTISNVPLYVFEREDVVEHGRILGAIMYNLLPVMPDLAWPIVPVMAESEDASCQQ